MRMTAALARPTRPYPASYEATSPHRTITAARGAGDADTDGLEVTEEDIHDPELLRAALLAKG